MEVLNQLLEEELSQAVEVKDAKSLRRWVMILTSSFAQKQAEDAARNEIMARFDRTDAKFDQTIAVMQERFAAMDKRFEERFAASDRLAHERFEAVNKRFEDANNRFGDMNNRFGDMNKRFDDMNKRFDATQWMIGIGMTLLATIMTLYRFIQQ